MTEIIGMFQENGHNMFTISADCTTKLLEEKTESYKASEISLLDEEKAFRLKMSQCDSTLITTQVKVKNLEHLNTTLKKELSQCKEMLAEYELLANKLYSSNALSPERYEFPPNTVPISKEKLEEYEKMSQDFLQLTKKELINDLRSVENNKEEDVIEEHKNEILKLREALQNMEKNYSLVISNQTGFINQLTHDFEVYKQYSSEENKALQERLLRLTPGDSANTQEQIKSLEDNYIEKINSLNEKLGIFQMENTQYQTQVIGLIEEISQLKKSLAAVSVVDSTSPFTEQLKAPYQAEGISEEIQTEEDFEFFKKCQTSFTTWKKKEEELVKRNLQLEAELKDILSQLFPSETTSVKNNDVDMMLNIMEDKKEKDILCLQEENKSLLESNYKLKEEILELKAKHEEQLNPVQESPEQSETLFKYIHQLSTKILELTTENHSLRKSLLEEGSMLNDEISSVKLQALSSSVSNSEEIKEKTPILKKMVNLINRSKSLIKSKNARITDLQCSAVSNKVQKEQTEAIDSFLRKRKKPE